MKLAAPGRQLCTPNSSAIINQPIQERATFVFPILTFSVNNHSPFNAKDDPLEMSLHDSVISGFCGTKSACMLADIRRFAKSGVLGMFQRRFLYQTMLLRYGHWMWVDKSRITTFPPIISAKSNAASRKYSCTSNVCSFYTHIAVEARVPRQTARCAHHNHSTLSGNTSSAEGSCISTMRAGGAALIYWI